MELQRQRIAEHSAAVDASSRAAPAPAGAWTVAEDFLRSQPIRDEESLRAFLSSFLADVLTKVELPVIRWAHAASARNDARELMTLDAALRDAPLPPKLVEASRRVGQMQMRKLQPLKGHRFLGRYGAALDAGETPGHNPVVYGIFLFVFSIPLREGLLNYCYQTIEGFSAAAASSLRLPAPRQRALIDPLLALLPQQVERSFAVEQKDLVAQRSGGDGATER